MASAYNTSISDMREVIYQIYPNERYKNKSDFQIRGMFLNMYRRGDIVYQNGIPIKASKRLKKSSTNKMNKNIPGQLSFVLSQEN